jgi:hypothetical protein
MANEPQKISTVKARGGVTPHIVRYVLLASLVLAVAAMVFVYASAPQGSQEGIATAAGAR